MMMARKIPSVKNAITLVWLVPIIVLVQIVTLLLTEN
jgi:hypothetical protein